MKAVKYISILLVVFLGTFLLFNSVVINKDSNVKTMKKPKSLLYSEKFGTQKSYDKPDLRTEGNLTNVRINQLAGVSEPKIVVNPLDEHNLAVVSNDFMLSGNSARFFNSVDGGLTWQSSTVPLSGLSGFDDATDPSVVFDADGNLFYAMIHYQLFGSGDGLFINKSNDKGLTWLNQATEVKKNFDAVTFEDRPSITADVSNSQYRNNLYVVWTSIERNSNKILFSKSSNSAASFSSPIELEVGNVHTADVKVNTVGQIFVSFVLDNSKIIVLSSNDGGETFSSPTVAATFEHSGVKSNSLYLLKKTATNSGIRVRSYPSMGIDLESNSLYITYSAKNGSDLSDVFLIKSLDNGQSWSSPIRVNSDNTNADQFMPELVVSNNVIYVAFQDSRNDEANRFVETYLAKSNDGGLTFTNEKISTSSFDPHSILLGNYIGDYIGLAISKSSVISVWTDGRNNNFDLYSGIISNTPSSVKEATLPLGFNVEQNYPNPFNPSTTINFNILKDGNVQIELYDISGKNVKTLLNAFLQKGEHSLKVDFEKINKGIVSGTYIYKVSFAGNSITKKMIFTK
ncbi:MAG: T9SS type A sorting domain-containing protein [Ignavibacteriaceae bacterium]|nr:T9SS type A sorting domain-containing protein [Ignavibacteriaceae bacterium]